MTYGKWKNGISSWDRGYQTTAVHKDKGLKNDHNADHSDDGSGLGHGQGGDNGSSELPTRVPALSVGAGAAGSMNGASAQTNEFAQSQDAGHGHPPMDDDDDHYGNGSSE